MGFGTLVLHMAAICLKYELETDNLVALQGWCLELNRWFQLTHCKII